MMKSAELLMHATPLKTEKIKQLFEDYKYLLLKKKLLCGHMPAERFFIHKDITGSRLKKVTDKGVLSWINENES